MPKKLEKIAKKLIGKGKSKSSAYAIATSVYKKSKKKGK